MPTSLHFLTVPAKYTLVARGNKRRMHLCGHQLLRLGRHHNGVHTLAWNHSQWRISAVCIGECSLGLLGEISGETEEYAPIENFSIPDKKYPITK